MKTLFHFSTSHSAIKYFKLKVFAFLFGSLALFLSCKKNIDAGKELSIQDNDDFTENNLNCSHCFITHTEDPNGSFDFFYNRVNNPDSIEINGTVF